MGTFARKKALFALLQQLRKVGRDVPPVSGGATGGLGDLIALPAKIDFLMRSNSMVKC